MKHNGRATTARPLLYVSAFAREDCLHSPGNSPTTLANGPEEYADKTGRYADASSKFWSQLDSVRFLASGARPLVPYDFLEQDPALAACVKQARLDYEAADQADRRAGETASSGRPGPHPRAQEIVPLRCGEVAITWFG